MVGRGVQYFAKMCFKHRSNFLNSTIYVLRIYIKCHLAFFYVCRLVIPEKRKQERIIPTFSLIAPSSSSSCTPVEAFLLPCRTYGSGVSGRGD